MLLADINEMETWDTDIGNTYLQLKSLDKIFIISGTEFGDREGCIIIVSIALYGLRSYVILCNKRFSDCLRDTVFFSWDLEPGIEM